MIGVLVVGGVEGRSLRSLGSFAAANLACYMVIDNELAFRGGNIKKWNKIHLTARLNNDTSHKQ